MALNKAVFKTRTLTAIVFAAVMLAGLFWNLGSFFILFAVIHFGCWFEYLKIIEKINNTTIDIVIKYFFAICGFTLFWILGLQNRWFDVGKEIFGVMVSFKVMIWLLLFIITLIFTFQNKQINAAAKKMMFAGFAYITIPLSLLLFLRTAFYDFSTYQNPDFAGEDLMKILPCAIIFSIWINDTMAYIVGSFIGKTPFSKISPKKTWEGTIGGAILAVVVMGALGCFVPVAKVLPLQHWLCIAAICAVFGTLGDLLESKLKRVAGIKDSGSFMPGHGGFLDRFDSLLIATPFVWLYVQLFV